MSKQQKQAGHGKMLPLSGASPPITTDIEERTGIKNLLDDCVDGPTAGKRDCIATCHYDRQGILCLPL